MLVQANQVVEGVNHKMRRQIDELERVVAADSSALSIDGISIDSYITRYRTPHRFSICFTFWTLDSARC